MGISIGNGFMCGYSDNFSIVGDRPFTGASVVASQTMVIVRHGKAISGIRFSQTRFCSALDPSGLVPLQRVSGAYLSQIPPNIAAFHLPELRLVQDCQ